MTTAAEIPASSLIELLGLFGEAGIEVWLDGGWGVDALLGRKSRKHSDVDVILRVADVPKVRRILKCRGFRFKEGSPPNSFVLADGSGQEVDIHAVIFDVQGNGIYRMQNGEEWVYPAEGFSGTGKVAGNDLRCLSPDTQVLCHAHGYAPTEKDFRDSELLKERFELELPPQLRRQARRASP